jgi:hypothetical protein
VGKMVGPANWMVSSVDVCGTGGSVIEKVSINVSESNISSNSCMEVTWI